ncbi:unnamed protein product [Peronospora destructor]|uniref:Uncharacterized protein n=1 Tax=Peronospora destructor TaxID=86335 RepID=A0AAV0U8U7_9STRA|nr:unnamed protein product [Peronospora destructor]
MRRCVAYACWRSESDHTASDWPLSHSVISGMAHERRDADVYIHEYEQQIAELYEELQQEKLKNEMMSKCLGDQKHAKAKLMKACKRAKQELQAVKDSGLSQMLADIEAKCDALEKENARIANELLVERSLREKQEAENDILAKQLEDLLFQLTKWEGIVARKNERLQQSRDQIYEHQLTIDNLKADLKLGDHKTTHSPEPCHEDDLEEIARLKHIISVERAALDVTKKYISKISAENGILREQLATKNESKFPEERVVPCAAQDTLNQVLVQVRFIKSKLSTLKKLVKTYEETNSIDISILDEGSWFQAEYSQDDNPRSCEEYAMQLSGGVFEAARYLAELQEVVEDICARLLGSSCALQ